MTLKKEKYLKFGSLIIHSPDEVTEVVSEISGRFVIAADISCISVRLKCSKKVRKLIKRRSTLPKLNKVL
jgi:hypothetical protein